MNYFIEAGSLINGMVVESEGTIQRVARREPVRGRIAQLASGKTVYVAPGVTCPPATKKVFEAKYCITFQSGQRKYFRKHDTLTLLATPVPRREEVSV